MLDTFSTDSLKEKATLYAKESLSHVRVGAVTIIGCNGDGDGGDEGGDDSDGDGGDDGDDNLAHFRVCVKM